MAGWVDVARKVVADKAFHEFDNGMVFDQFSASVMVQVHDAMSEANQARFAAMDVVKAQEVAFKVVAKVRSKK